MSNLGWNEGTWGNNPWGGRITVAVTVSGLSATASTNDIPAVHFNAPLPIFLAYSDGTWGAGPWGGRVSTAFGVDGVQATSALGDEQTFIANVAEPTGLSATTALGFNPATDIIIPTTFSVTGVSATVGFLSGWGSSAWDGGVWGGGVFADPGQTIEPSGVEGTSATRSPTVTGSSAFTVTGVQGSGELGDEGTVPQNLVAVTQAAMTGAIGNTVETGTGLFSTTGNSAETLIAGTSSSTITFTVTVVSGNPSNHPYYNVGSTNKYAIDGSTATADVTLELYEGNTYRFDQSDSSNAGHPLRFSLSENGTHNFGTEYTTGVTTNGTPGSSGAYTEITVAAGVGTLYYYCSNHSNMGWEASTPISVLVITTTGAPVTNVVGTTALGNETVIGAADVAVTLAGLNISLGTLALTGTSVLSLTGVSATGGTGEEQVYSIITPTQIANWVEKAA